MSCPLLPPPAPEGEGAERRFGVDVTRWSVIPGPASVARYRCRNGHQWEDGSWPYLEMECLNRRWVPPTLPQCVRKYTWLIVTTTSQVDVSVMVSRLV